MTSINLYIIKHTFSEQYGSEYFFNFTPLLEQEISTELAQSLENFFQKVMAYLSQSYATFHPTLGNSMELYSSPGKNYSYSAWGFVNHSDYENVFLTKDFVIELFDAVNRLYSDLGWNLSAPKIYIVENVTFNEVTQKYENLKFSFDEIENMYNQGTEYNT
jgi:hypothetical protein